MTRAADPHDREDHVEHPTEVVDGPDGTVSLRNDRAAVTVDPARGCRLTSFAVGGQELLSDGYDPRVVEHVDDPPFGWGCFLMAPWAGRVRDARATWDDRTLTLPEHEDGHAIHGFVHSVPWERIEPTAWRVEVPADRWFARLEVVHRVELRPDHLHLRLEVSAPDRPAPATVGWHPWFRREIDGAALELALPPARMLERDDQGIATSRRVEVPTPPWDDAFVSIDAPVRLTWPGVTTLGIESDAPVTVVFTERATVACVEPQSGPPDEVNQHPRVVRPGEPLELATRWRWSRV
jgi:aldose 1-epimerase